LKNTLICIGAGKSQYPVISIAKELGYAVVVLDQNPDAPGFEIADEKICSSTFDVGPLLEPIEILSKKYNITGILNRSSGPPVVTAAILAAQLQLPYYSEKSAISIVNKHLLMETCSEYGISAPKSYALSKGEELNTEGINYPCVVKPSLSLLGKSGITVVNDKDKLNDAINYAFSFTINDCISIDEYIEGKDISFVSFVDDGELVPICLLDEINTNDEDGKMTGKGFAMPSAHESTIIDLVELSTKNIIDTFGITRSPLMVSFRIDNTNTPKLIEVHLDLGGDLLIEKLFPKALNYNFLEHSIQLLAGEKPSIPNINIIPTAIIFDKSDDLVSEKKNTLIQAKDRMDLDTLIYSNIAQ